MIPKTIIHLLSGGMDSTVLLYDLVGQEHKVHCVLFDYGQRHVKELGFAARHCERLKVKSTTIRIPQLRGSDLTDGCGSVVVPNRNAILLNIAVNIAIAAKADTVTFAANKDDEEVFPDCRRAFLDAMNACVKAAGYDIEICAPYLDKAKWWIGGHGQNMRVPFQDTWSCYWDREKPCGACPACIKRQEALSDDAPAYERDPVSVVETSWGGKGGID